MPHRQRERNAIQSDSRALNDGSFRFAIKIAFDGTDYQGFQSQAHGNTIQDQIEKRLQRLLRRPLRIFGWGRTDSGVHASGAVVSVDLTQEEVQRLATARSDARKSVSELTSAAKLLHSTLREFSCDGGVGSITALSAVHAPIAFDARFSCLWKRYVYQISFGSRQRSPFLNRYAWQMDQKLDVPKMIVAAEALSGKHNFEWMSVTQEDERRDPWRILTLTVEQVPIDAISIIFPSNTNGCKMLKIAGTCDFFLYRMMRRLVGILVCIGKHQMEQRALDACIYYHDRVPGSGSESKQVPPEFLYTAPAKGLSLDHIEYDFSI